MLFVIDAQLPQILRALPEIVNAIERGEAILSDYPYLESADIDAALAFAARHADHPIIAAE